MDPVKYFKALADETRLRLLNIFLHYEMNVNEIVETLSMGQSRISRHLKILTDTKLITFRRDGGWTFYSAVSEGEGEEFIKGIKYLFENENEALFQEDLKEAKRMIEERSREAVRFFDSIAEDWGKLKKEIIGNFNINSLILKHIPKSNIIVDLGCGTGELLSSIKEKADKVIGVDKSPRMLEQTRKRFFYDEESVDLRIGEIEHLPLRDGEADVAIINMVLHHVPSPSKAIQEIHRVLKSGDFFIIVDLINHNLENMRNKYGDRWLGFSRNEIINWLEREGFAFKGIEYFGLSKGLSGFLVISEKK
jgi:ubiquinone/menaquinone biosynthesis C-methylase UbiE